MASVTQVNNGHATKPRAAVKKIVVDYDDFNSTSAVSVTPGKIAKGSTICFTSPKGKIRVVFVSPFNTDTVEVLDSETRTLHVGGVYHFRCFFTEEGKNEVESRTGGVLDIEPHRP